MNYYTNSNDYSMFNGNRYYDECNNDYNSNEDYNNYYNNTPCRNSYHSKPNCCIKRVEETYLCFPSYYNEDKSDKKEDNKENCFEGTFRICPKFNKKDDCNKCHNPENNEDEHKCARHCHKRCGFCGLFRRW